MDGSTGRRAPAVDGQAGSRTLKGREGSGSWWWVQRGQTVALQAPTLSLLRRRGAGVVSAARARPLTLTSATDLVTGMTERRHGTGSPVWRMHPTLDAAQSVLFGSIKGDHGDGDGDGGLVSAGVGVWSLEPGVWRPHHHSDTPVTMTSQLDIRWPKMRNGVLS